MHDRPAPAARALREPRSLRHRSRLPGEATHRCLRAVLRRITHLSQSRQAFQGDRRL